MTFNASARPRAGAFLFAKKVGRHEVVLTGYPPCNSTTKSTPPLRELKAPAPRAFLVRRQLQDRCLLPDREICQQHDRPVREFERVMMPGRLT